MSNLTDLIADPLYQTNLVLLMLQPSKKASVKPLLYEAGFKLRDIEPELALPKELREQFDADKIQINKVVAPDLILVNENSDYVIFECKRTMFGSVPQQGKSDGQIKQARACLLQTPKNLAAALSLRTKDITDSWLVYLSRHDPNKPQTKGLKEISDELAKHGHRTTNFGLLGLSQDGMFIYLNKNYNPSTLPKSINDLFKKAPIVAHELDDPKEAPQIYYPLPWMPHSSHENDLNSERAFGNAILQQVASIIGKQKVPCEVELPIDSIINLATKGFYSKWRKRDAVKTLRTSTKKLIKNALTPTISESELKYVSNTHNAAWRFSIDDAKVHSQIIENLRKWKAKKWININQGVLFQID
jgi:hypothetical protein